MAVDSISFEPQEFYKLALALTQSDSTEKSLRTAIGRAYFACHLIARTRLMRGKWRPVGGAPDHAAIIRELRNRNRHNLADQLDHLRELREHADYHLYLDLDETNPDCEICKRLRDSLPDSSGSAVRTHHWQDANRYADRLLPNLKTL